MRDAAGNAGHRPLAQPRAARRRRPGGRRAGARDGVLADVAPTILELAGLPRWDGMTGRSLLEPVIARPGAGLLPSAAVTHGGLHS